MHLGINDFLPVIRLIIIVSALCKRHKVTTMYRSLNFLEMSEFNVTVSTDPSEKARTEEQALFQ